MRNLHQITVPLSEEVLITLWYNKDFLGKEVGISGGFVVFKDPYYGPNGRWYPVPPNSPDDVVYMKEIWAQFNKPAVDISNIPRGIKLD